MATFGEINPHARMLNRVLPPRGPMVYPSGIKEGDKGYERFAPPSSKHPNLIIVNPIYDNDDNVIMPGYYELILTADRQMLILAQAGKEIARFPVFKIEEDKTQEQTPQPMDKKSQKKFNKEQKKKEKARKKAIKQGKIPDEEQQEYTDATIQYDEKGDYYLVKYERGKIRAWGAIKTSEWY